MPHDIRRMRPGSSTVAGRHQIALSAGRHSDAAECDSVDGEKGYTVLQTAAIRLVRRTAMQTVCDATRSSPLGWQAVRVVCVGTWQILRLVSFVSSSRGLQGSADHEGPVPESNGMFEGTAAAQQG